MRVCTICDEPIEDGEPYRVVRSRTAGLSPVAYTHRGCRRAPSVVPFIASWSSEATGDPDVVLRSLLGGVGYAGELPSDRDNRGALWLRRGSSPGVGRPLYGVVHPGRQRLAMRRLLCQVCGEPADQDDRGTLWLLEDARGSHDGWPEDMLTTHPPICRPCLRMAREQCPHLWAGSVAVRVGRSDVCAVYGRRYSLGRLGPLAVEADIVSLTSPLLPWVVASQLVRGLNDCAVVSVDEELAALP
ncbi:hypothetical protein [Streptomyces sp. NPDC006527]|uniref:hypothetical protein n=1 Tax=Streptomyces sp. NPDC006527 TaxID=3364749 RepID=UPI0036C10C77